MKEFLPKRNVKSIAYVKSMDEYKEMYDRSIKDPDGFWSEHAECIHWFKKWKKVRDCDFKKAKVAWFIGGKTNACYNCLDRHVEAGRGDKVALIWEGNDPSESRKFTYAELFVEVKKFANVLKKHDLKKGDAVTFYLPMIPELPIAMLACARIGVIHNVVFGGFSAESLKTRIVDAQAKMVVVSDGSFRAEKKIPLKKNCDDAIEGLGFVRKCIVVERTGREIEMLEGRDFLWNEEMALAGDECPCEELDAEDPLFILYTSGSTGKPKGVLHTNGGYMVFASMTHKYVFDYHEKDIFWCTADVGWITGHTYIVYGPLANNATSIMFEGVPSFPDYGRFWDIVDKYKVTQFYTAPTVIRACMKEGDEWVSKHDLSSLRILGTVGEPINPEAWLWYHRVVGKGRCPVLDTWWQTESGGILVTPLPGATPLKAGSATFPFFGVEPAILDDKGKEIKNTAAGNLVLKTSWPGMMVGVYRDPERFKKTYFDDFPGYYLTGDGAHRDEEGYYWITGRVDDVLKVSGHRMGTAELESAFDSHDSVAETAVVGVSHEIKGQAIYAFVVLNTGVKPSDDLKKELVQIVRKEIGPIATPEFIQFAEGLPKTRSGKIMRRILRKIAVGEKDLGDISTLADPSVIDKLVEDRKK